MNDIISFISAHLPAFVVAVPLLGAFLTPLVSRIGDKSRNIFAIIITGLTSIFALLLANDVFTNGIRTYVFGGDYATGQTMVRILFEIDAMNAFMLIIAAILPFAAIVYSWGFMKEQTGLDKYYTLILLMTAGMLGMMMTGDMFNFFVFLEITSIASAALIAFWTNKGNAVAAAFKYIVISSIGALFVLFAIALYYGQYNALNMAVIADSIPVEMGFVDKIALVLLLAALAMKAAIAPMHMWLADAYGRAPSSVTVVLIGTTLASLYAGFRVIFTIHGNQLEQALNSWTIFGYEFSISLANMVGILLVALAVLSIFIGVFMALKQVDLKKMIAYTAVAEIGYMLLAVGAAIAVMGGDLEATAGYTALKGGIFHILNDALDIGLLFLVAGAVYYTAKQTSINKLGGLARNMKYTTVFFLIGLFAVSGLPPMNGFASKLMIYESTFQINPILSIVAILCSILLLAVFVKVFYSVFLGPKLPKFATAKEVPISMLIAMGIIACIIIFIGLFPDIVLQNVVTPAANALNDASSYIAAITGGI